MSQGSLFDPSFEGAVAKVKRMRFPNEEQMKRGEKDLNYGSHSFGVGSREVRHPLQKFSLESKLDGYKISFSLVWCPTCKQVRSESAVLFNDAENTCYQRFFIRGGEYQ